MLLTDKTHFLPPKGHRARQLALAFLILAPFAFGALAVALGQDANWDLRNYHWYNAYALLNGRYGFDILPSQTPWFYNPALDVPFYLLATHAPAIAAGFALGFVQGLNAILLFMLAHASLRIANPRHKVIVCAGLATLGMLGGGGIALLGATFYDNVTSLGIFLSALLVLSRSHELLETSHVRAFGLVLLFGVPAGLMMGLKLPSVIFPAGLCAALVLSGGAWQRRFLLGFAFGIGVLLGLAVTLGPWAWFLQTHFGSPLFPYFNNIFKSPLAPAASARDIQFVPNSLKDYVLFPFIFTEYPQRVGEIPWRDLRLPFLYVLLPLAVMLRLVFGRNRGHDSAIATPYATRYLLWTAVLSYGAWIVMFSVYRYAVPLEMLAPLLIVLAAGMLPLGAQPRALFTAFLLLAIAVTIQPGNWHRRATWLDRFVTADIPPLEDASHLMILMAGIEPYSHIITQFPPGIPFVRIQSNFTSPDQDKGINKLIRDRVAAHQGPFMILIPSWQHGQADSAMKFFGLKGDWRGCKPVTDHLYDDKTLDLCPVNRVPE